MGDGTVLVEYYPYSQAITLISLHYNQVAEWAEFTVRSGYWVKLVFSLTAKPGEGFGVVFLFVATKILQGVFKTLWLTMSDELMRHSDIIRFPQS